MMQRECLQRHPDPLFGVAAAAAQADSGACRFAAGSVEPGCSCAGDRIAELVDRDEPAGLGAVGDAPGLLRFFLCVHLGIFKGEVSFEEVALNK